MVVVLRRRATTTREVVLRRRETTTREQQQMNQIPNDQADEYQYGGHNGGNQGRKNESFLRSFTLFQLAGQKNLPLRYQIQLLLLYLLKSFCYTS